MNMIPAKRIAVLLIVALTCADDASASPFYAARSWNEERAAHLLRRAGFGGTPEEIRQFTELGVKAAVDRLVDFESIPQTHPDYVPFAIPSESQLRDESKRRTGIPGSDRAEVRKQVSQIIRSLHMLQMDDLKAWWLQRMIVTSRPLEEKMTLFWHGLFATEFRTVRDAGMMVRQHQFLRAHAAGNLRDLLIGISQDPAMLVYLDNSSNRKDHPNENYAREFLELFTMGRGHYTEQDVREAARALTGWGVRDGKFHADPKQHDFGKKRFLGAEGYFDGEDIIDIVLRRNATSRHFAKELLEYFMMEDPDERLIDGLELILRQNQYDIRETLRTLLRSEVFYGDSARFSLVKSPVELVVNAARLLKMEPANLHEWSTATDLMGQTLFQPPSVKGWDGGLKWINTATLFTRYSFAARIVEGSEKVERGSEQETARLASAIESLPSSLRLLGIRTPHRAIVSSPAGPYDPSNALEQYDLTSAEGLTDHYVSRLLQRPIDETLRRALIEIVTHGKRGQPETSLDADRIRKLIIAILCTPEFQVY